MDWVLWGACAQGFSPPIWLMTRAFTNFGYVYKKGWCLTEFSYFPDNLEKRNPVSMFLKSLKVQLFLILVFSRLIYSILKVNESQDILLLGEHPDILRIFHLVICLVFIDPTAVISSGQNCVQWGAQNGKQPLVCPCLAASDNEITPLLSLFWNVSNRRVTSVTCNLDSILKSRDFTLPTKVHLVKAMVLVMYKCESWTVKKAEAKNWCLWIAVLEKTLASPLDCKEIQPVHPKGNQSWIFIGRTDAEAETLILWPPNMKNWIIWKDPDAGKDWGQEEKGMTEDEMVK